MLHHMSRAETVLLLLTVCDLLTHTTHFKQPSCLARTSDFSARSVQVRQSTLMRSSRWKKEYGATHDWKMKFCFLSLRSLYNTALAILCIICYSNNITTSSLPFTTNMGTWRKSDREHCRQLTKTFEVTGMQLWSLIKITGHSGD